MNKRRGFSLIICVLLSVLGLATLMTFVADARPAGAAQALSLIVTNTNDGGPGSLRQAIADAGLGGSIDFALSYPATITLTSGELLITKPLTITGPGPALLAISGDHASRVFRVDDPAGAAQITVTLSGLTIRDGDTAGNGGGLRNDENLTLADVIFSGNSATSGGGMYNFGSNPTLTDVTFRHNSSGSGGGMHNDSSSPVLMDVTFRDNSAGSGGGMYNDSSNPTLTGVTFSGNSSTWDGGGMNNRDSNPTLTGVTFSRNAAGWSGGGIFNGSGSPTLTGVTFYGNSAGWDGGGIYNEYNSNPTLTDVTFNGNAADLLGGGMYNYVSNPALRDVTFNGNSASDGGGIYNYDSDPTLTNVTFSGNAAHSYGGGMLNGTNSSPGLTNVTFSGNAAGSGGGLYNWGASNPTIRNSIVWGNHAVAAGNQIYNMQSTPAIAFSDVQGSGGSGPGWDPDLGSDLGGNLDADPRFVAAGNLRLRWGSPAIDAGDNSLVPPGVTTDLDGVPRFAYGTVDMGAYELQPGLYLYKNAGVTRVAPGQRITYTLQAANAFTATAMTGGLISDALPAGLVFAGPITLEPPGAGVVGAAPPILVSDLTLNPAQIVTITFPVTITPGLAAFTILTNSAAVTSSQVLTPQLAYHTIVVVGYYYYLPIIFRGGGS